MSIHRKATTWLGKLNSLYLSKELTTPDARLDAENNSKLDVVVKLNSVVGGNAVTFKVEELVSDFWYQTATTPALAVAQNYGLANANFPFLGKGDHPRIVATTSVSGGTFDADVYLISYDN